MNIDFKKPIRLEISRVWRTYLGGKLISALHGEESEDDHFPEEWLMSTVSARNSGREHITEGISLIAGTDLALADLVEAYPLELLGEKHIKAHGKSLGVLVKLLDSAERLTLQVHPTKEIAKKLFNSEFGKTECWHIIGERQINNEKSCIYIGFKEGVTKEKWKRCFDEQNIPAMLNCLHKIPVKKGDTFIIRGGVPHGIGTGCFLVEIQEPTDYTIRTERTTPSGLKISDFMCHQDLGFDKMFECFTFNGATLEDTISRYKVKPKTEKTDGYTVKHIIYPDVTDMFALDLIEVSKTFNLNTNGTFCGIYILSGKGTLNGEAVNKCAHYFIPASCKSLTLKASADTPLTFIRCFGPTLKG